MRKTPCAQPAEVGQRQIVRGREADRASLDEGSEDALRADAPIVGIRALQHLVDEEEERDGSRPESSSSWRKRVISA